MKLTRFRNLGISALLAFGLIGFVNLADFSWTVPGFEKLTGGVTLLDIQPSFTAETTYRIIDAYGDAGRHRYLQFLLTLDVVLPLTIFAFLRIAVALALSHGYAPSSVMQRLYFLPSLYLVLDYTENAVIFLLLTQYPTHLPLLAGAVGYVTTAKNVFAWSSLALAGVGLLLALWRGQVKCVKTSQTTNRS